MVLGTFTKCLRNGISRTLEASSPLTSQKTKKARMCSVSILTTASPRRCGKNPVIAAVAVSLDIWNAFNLEDWGMIHELEYMDFLPYIWRIFGSYIGGRVLLLCNDELREPITMKITCTCLGLSAITSSRTPCSIFLCLWERSRSTTWTTRISWRKMTQWKRCRTATTPRS